MLVVEKLKKEMHGQVILDGVDLKIDDGSRHVVVGKSGAGKSVLLKAIIGLVEPDGGRIFLDGDDVTLLSESEYNTRVRSIMSMVFQQGALWDSMTVAENIDLALNLRTHLTLAERRDVVSESLELVGLAGSNNKYPEELSGGMLKRAAIARAIAIRPRYLLYDEPTTGLDPVLTNMVVDLITSLNERLNVTALIISHDIASIPRLSDTVSMLHEGRIVATCPSAEMWDIDNPVFRNFIRGKGAAR